MMTSENTIIMIANMKTAAIVEAIFSSALSARNTRSSNPVSPLSPPLLRRDRRNRSVEFLQGFAALLAAAVEAVGPGLVDALHQVLELRFRLRRQRLELDALG